MLATLIWQVSITSQLLPMLDGSPTPTHSWPVVGFPSAVSIPELIADLSKFYHLRPGDLIFTGTLEGVGPLQPGDRIDGQVEGAGSIALSVGPAE
jgi:hypothetical protein